MASSGTPGAVSKLRDGLFTASLNYVVCVTPEVFVAFCCFVAAKKQPPEAARLTNCTLTFELCDVRLNPLFRTCLDQRISKRILDQQNPKKRNHFIAFGMKEF